MDESKHAGGSHAVRLLITAGLIFGTLLGFSGTFVPHGTTQNVVYSLNEIFMIIGCIFYGARLARHNKDIAAVGFALLTLCEAIILSGGTPTDAGSDISFAASTIIRTLGLLLISLPAAFPIWVRIVGTLCAIPFALHYFFWLFGAGPAANSTFTNLGYPLLALTVIGWLISLLRRQPAS